jgi:hypothetical protein
VVPYRWQANCSATDSAGTAAAVLRLSPGDVDVLACKAIANLQLGEYEEAAKVLAHKQLQQEMHFERVSAPAAPATAVGCV